MKTLNESGLGLVLEARDLASIPPGERVVVARCLLKDSKQAQCLRPLDHGGNCASAYERAAKA